VSDKTDRLQKSLYQFGLTHNESAVYLHLVSHGFQSVLAISRILQLPRTRIYRIIDKLMQKKLVVQKLDERGMKFGAADPARFKQLIQQKQLEVTELNKSYDTLFTQIQSLQNKQLPKTDVLYFSGKAGLQQITYNSTKAHGILRIYEGVNDMSAFMSQKLAEDFRRHFVENNVIVHQLTPFTTIDNHTENTDFTKAHMKIRYIDPTDITIGPDILIYDNVFALYQTQEDELIGIEMHNAAIATMQKQLFDFIWDKAIPMNFTSLHGSATI
jgi:sugar-specific transcriptional regulator TrmB